MRRAFLAFPPMLKPGGKITVDVYPWLVRNLAWSKYWLRLITRRLPTNTLFRVVERATPAHDDPQRQTTLAAWFAEAGLEECVTERVWSWDETACRGRCGRGGRKSCT